MYNRVLLIGNLGKDPETKYTPKGLAVTTFSLATSERRGEEEKTQWHNVVAFGKTAEAAGQYLSKGKRVFVEGKIIYENYNDKTGQRRSATKIYADRLNFLGGGQDRHDTVRPEADPGAQPAGSTLADDDIPF